MFKIKETRFILFATLALTFLVSFIGRVQLTARNDQKDSEPAKLEIGLKEESTEETSEPRKEKVVQVEPEDKTEKEPESEPETESEEDGITIILE